MPQFCASMVNIKPIKIEFSQILSYCKKRKNHSDYTRGGWYMIWDNAKKMGYVGKSIEYMERLKSHVHCANKNTNLFINKAMHGNIDNFEFYLLLDYSSVGISFFNRHLESEIESELIKELKTYYPFGYNVFKYKKLNKI